MPNTYARPEQIQREDDAKAERKLAEQFAAINAVMAARRKAGCRSLTCDGCGNEACVIAGKEYQELWPEEKTEVLNQPVLAANTHRLSMEKRASQRLAELQKLRAETLLGRRGIGVNGSSKNLPHFNGNGAG